MASLKRWFSVCLLAICVAKFYGELCNVQPECSCSSAQRSYIRCDKLYGPYIPKFAKSSVLHYAAIITANRGVTQIRDRTFDGTMVRELRVLSSGISYIGCSALDGLTQSLSKVVLNNNLLIHVPNCTLSQYKSLTSLSLSTNRITHLLRDTFLNFSQMETLDFSLNRISAIQPGTFRGLDKLRTLDLSGNAIEDLKASSFIELMSITTLKLQNNKIAHLHTRTFDGLEKLENLFISQNQLTSMDDTLFRGTRELRHLDINNNILTAFADEVLTGLHKLQFFHAENNSLTILPKILFQDTGNLQELKLSQNQISRVIPGTFEGLSKLRSLDMKQNLISVIEKSMFRGITDYLTIHLGDNRLTEINTDAFIECPKIISVYLQNNSIKRLRARAFRNLTRLRQIDLSKNQIEQIDQGVFYNVSQLGNLIIDDNQISFIHENAFDEIKRTLTALHLKGNNLPSTSWIWLEKALTNLTALSTIDLSHNPLQFVPSDVLMQFEDFREVRLMNCSIDYITNNSINIFSNNFQMSSNVLKSLTTIEINRQFGNFWTVCNISNNQIPSLNVKLYSISRYRRVQIIADNNKILTRLSLSIEDSQFTNWGPSISLKNNSMQEPLQLYVRSDHRRSHLPNIELDISSNTFRDISRFPLEVLTTLGESYWNPCNYSFGIGNNILVETLNLSNNAIASISSYACLGAVRTLDLRNNHLKVIGKLMTSIDQHEFRLEKLYLSGNRIHQVTTDAFFSYETKFRSIDLRHNQLTDLNVFRSLLSESSFQKLSLVGNPLLCGCDIAWLRNDSVVKRLDSVRCESPSEFDRYLVWCFAFPEVCSAVFTRTNTEATQRTCDEDSNLEVSDVTVKVMEHFINVTWTTTGPGVITGFRLTYSSVDNAAEVVAVWVHPNENSAILAGLFPGNLYNICVTAVLESGSATSSPCSEIPSIAADVSCAELGAVIGLASALGVCVLLIVALVWCLVCRRHSSQQSNVPITEPPTVLMETQRNNYTNNGKDKRMSDESVYEDVDMETYVNAGFNE